MTRQTTEKENILDITDKPEGTEYITFCGKTIRTHQYKNIAPPNEVEISSWKECLPDMEREVKEAEEFFENQDKALGVSVSGRSPIPYDIIERDGATIIQPATFINGERQPPLSGNNLLDKS